MSINPITNNLITQRTSAILKENERNSKKQSVQASIFYVNDIHGKTLNMERMATVSNAFDCFCRKSDVQRDELKLSSGDIQLGSDRGINESAVKFQNAIGIQASAVGNHEFDIAWENPEKLTNLLQKANYKLLTDNLNIKNNKELNEKFERYAIQEINGHKYGLIGTSPVDLIGRIRKGVLTDNVEVKNLDETIAEIQKDVNELKTQGIDKIILLSHLGYDNDVKVAQRSEGIDVILGGHSHDLLRGIEDGKNIFRSLSGEPVIITQGGRDGNHFGILNVEFNENGVVSKAQNNIAYATDFRRSMIMKYIIESILGKPDKLAYLKSVEKPPKKVLIEPTGHANFILDCMKDDCDADIALMPAPEIRGFFEEGTLDSRLLNEILPFKNKAVIINYSEKEIVDALKYSATSLKNNDSRPGIMEVSGLEYGISRNGELKYVNFIDKNGQKSPINIERPRTDKFYKTVINDFHALGNDNFAMLDKYDKAEQITDYDITGCVKNYLKKVKSPIEIVDDGRIKIMD